MMSVSTSGSIAKKVGGGMCGLVNQGATCYLNSLLQNLFYDVHIRESIMSSTTDNVLVSAIQGLFARLMLSEATSIKTTDLVTAFGWSRASVFEQHDAQELLTVLLDSLGESCPDIAERLNAIVRGSVEEYLECPECQFKRSGVSTFMNISLELPVHDDKVNTNEPEMEDLSSLLHNHMRAETLDDDNKWECGGCQQRVRAKKYNLYKTLPPSLFIHLKRFRYNIKLRRREKITSAITFPDLLDTTMLTGVGEKSSQYRLQGILLHTGTASGGHYKSYNRVANQKWLECNDASVREMTEQEVASMFSSAPAKDSANETEPHQNESKSVLSGVAAGNTPPSARRFVTAKDDLLRQNAYMLLYKHDSYEEDQLEQLNVSCLKAIREEVKIAIQAENDQLVESRRLQEIHRKEVVLQIFLPCSTAIDDGTVCSPLSSAAPQIKTTLTVTINETFGEVLDKVLVQLNHDYQMNLVGDVIGESMGAFIGTPCRLRMYDATKGRAGETFGERMHVSLLDLGFKGCGAQTTLLLETRDREKDAMFAEYNPKDMYVRMLSWSEDVCQALSISDGALLNQLIAGDLDRKALMMEDESSDEPLGDALSNAIITLTTATQLVHVSGQENATVKHLREAVTEKTMVGDDQMIVMIQTNDRGTCELLSEDDQKGLRNSFGLWPADLIIVEVVKKSEGLQQGPALEAAEATQEKETSEAGGMEGNGVREGPPGVGKQERKGHESAALQVIKSMRHCIRIQFNDPRILASSTECSSSPTIPPAYPPGNDASVLATEAPLLTSSSNATAATTTTTGDIYTYSLRVSSELSLHQLKEEIAKSLMDPLLCFHVQGASFKDETKSLLQLGLCNMSILHLVAGKGCQPGEHMLSFYCDLGEMKEEENKNDGDGKKTGGKDDKIKPSSMIFLAELPVSEKWTVRQLKEHLLQHWSMFESASTGPATLPPPPMSPLHIRLRDGGKNTTTSTIAASTGLGGGGGGSLLRDDRVLCRCLLGLADHRRIVLQILPVPEIIDKDDWIFSIRIATYTSMEESKLTHKYASKRIHRSIDLPIARTSTVQQLYQKLLEMLPFFQMAAAGEAVAATAGATSTAETSDGNSSINNNNDDDAVSRAHSHPFPESQFISVAKGYATGPAMTIKTSLKLPWDFFQQYPTVKLNASMLGLRDGTVLVVRGVTDFHQSQLVGTAAPSTATGNETDFTSDSLVDGESAASPPAAASSSCAATENNKRIPPWKLKGNSKTTASSSSVDITAAKGVGNSSSPKAAKGSGTGGAGSTAKRKPMEKGIHIAVSRPSAVLKSAQSLDLVISNTLNIIPDPNHDDHDHHSTMSSVVLPPTSPYFGKENYPLLNGEVNDTGGLDETKSKSSASITPRNNETMD